MKTNSARSALNGAQPAELLHVRVAVRVLHDDNLANVQIRAREMRTVAEERSGFIIHIKAWNVREEAVAKFRRIKQLDAIGREAAAPRRDPHGFNPHRKARHLREKRFNGLL